MKNIKRIVFGGIGAAGLLVTLATIDFSNIFTASAHPRTVKVAVSKNGFEPASIEVEKGHRVNLVFNRADKNNCGSQVVFPKLGIRKALPVGKDVVVSFTPQKVGDIAFTCGMKMYKGQIVVSENGHNE